MLCHGRHPGIDQNLKRVIYSRNQQNSKPNVMQLLHSPTDTYQQRYKMKVMLIIVDQRFGGNIRAEEYVI